MAQPGVLGNLKYTEQENGWALSFGYNLGLYEVMSMAIRPVADRDTETTSISNKRETALKDLNHELKRRHIQYEIPDTTDADRLVWLTQDLFEQFGRHPLAAQLPYVLIGTAVYSLVARHLVGGILDDYFLGVAYSRLEALTYRCDDVNVQVDALFIHLSRCTTLESARRLLRQLQAHMTILLVSADPQDQDRLRLTTEERALQEALRSADYNQSFKFKTLPSCRPGDLASGLRRYRPTFVHFSGHGSKTGLCFEDANGNAVLIEPEKLAGLLALACEGGLKGVVLNACYTKEQADCIANVVGDVVAMEGLVGDEAAIDFASQFYAALGDGCEFHHAFNWALAGTGLGRSTGLLKPHLIRSKLVIDAHNIHKPTPKTRDDGSGLAARDSSANRSVDDLEEGIYTGTGHMDETLRRVAAERNSPTANPFASSLIRHDSMVQAFGYPEENLAPKDFTESIENAKMKKRAPPVPLPKKEKLRDRRSFEKNILAVADADQGFPGSSSSQMRQTPASLPMFSLTASSQLADAPESSNDERAGTHLGNDEVYPKSGNNTAQGGAELRES